MILKSLFPILLLAILVFAFCDAKTKLADLLDEILDPKKEKGRG